MGCPPRPLRSGSASNDSSGVNEKCTSNYSVKPVLSMTGRPIIFDRVKVSADIVTCPPSKRAPVGPALIETLPHGVGGPSPELRGGAPRPGLLRPTIKQLRSLGVGNFTPSLTAV